MDKPGVIHKISVTNFVTYTYAEMYPGPHLNMIIGPNGTGKSTMVAAIILGLGGNPKTVGRGSKVSEYVKHHCEEARIDIILKANNEHNSNTITITREFDLQDKTCWQIDGKKVSLKDMLTAIKAYNIQVDNLCQFLPQDRVQDFAKMNKQQLLKQTKVAVCRDDLIEKQENLIQRRIRHKVILQNCDKRKKKLQEAKDANTRLEGKVQNFNKRRKFLDVVKNINRKIAWRKYEDIVEKRNQIKVDKEQAAQILNNHKKSAAPIEAAIKNIKTMVAKLREAVARDEDNIRLATNEVQKNSDKYKKLKDSIREVKIEMKARITEIAQRETDIRTANMKLLKLQSDKEDLLKTCGTQNEMGEKVQRHTREIQQISSHIADIEAKKSELLALKRDKIYEMRALENEVKKIENVKQQRLEELRKRDPDAYKATLWLRKNTHIFQGQVFEPMLLELNVINPKNAIYLENSVGFRDRIAITCTTKEDMNTLIRTFRDTEKLSVNIVYSNPDEAIHNYRPRIPIERLRKYGLHAYLLSLVSGPSPLITYLCKNYGIHNTPVGDATTNKCFEDVPQEISSFFSDKFRFSCSYSRYTGEKIVRQNEIRPDGSLSISVDLAKLENIQGQLNDNSRSCEQFNNQIQTLQNSIEQLGATKEKLAESMRKLRSMYQNIQTIDSQIRVVQSNIQQLQQESITEADVRKQADEKIKVIVKEIVNLQKVISEKFANVSHLLTDKEKKVLKMSILEKKITFLENEAQDLRQLCQEAENTLQNIKQVYNDITNEAKQALQKGKELSNGFTPDDEGFNEFREEYDTLTDNIEELEQEKNEIISRMECLNSADEAEMREYEERVKLIEELEDSFRNDNNELENITRKMGKLESEYLTSLQELVNQISSRFSAAFERMGCAGDVTIYTGDNSQDYEQYGLSIRVTYRDGEPLQELNNITQSGGERAVATATYMLSLQELTPVPFRCVDEINQGMDEINERRIFELLFESTSQPNTSQYFLITPKLVPNLNYVPTMKIHFVHNGPFVASQTEWNRVRVT